MNGHLLNKFGKGIALVVYAVFLKGLSGRDLQKNVLDKISRRVVSLASFNGDFYSYYDHYFSVLVFGHS